MIFSNVRFIDAAVSNSGDGLTPSSPWKDLPTYDNFVNDCLYILRRYPSIARCQSMVSPNDMVSSENSKWVVSQDSYYDENHSGYRAFDGSDNSDFGFVTSSESSFPHFISIRNKDEKICVGSYKIKTRFNSSNNENYNPQEWYLECSDDGENWTELDHREISWSSSDYGTKTFDIGNKNSYYYYRIRFISGNDQDKLSIGEIEFYDNPIYNNNYYSLPAFSSLRSGITNFAFIGCPEEGDRFWDVLSDSQKNLLSEAGWLNSGNEYATIYCPVVNSVNIAISSRCSFYTENIDYLRNPDNSTLFDTSFDGDTNRNMFFFKGGNYIISIRNCRFSAKGVNIDDERYVEPSPPMKCCAYMRCSGMVDKLVFENNIVNYIPYSVSNRNYCYDGFVFGARIAGAYVTKNKFYMTKSDTSTWINSSNNTGDNNSPYRVSCFYVSGEDLGNAVFQQTRFFAFNYNELVVRVNNYNNLNRWVCCTTAEKVEFIGNRITQGRDMGSYDSNNMNLCLYGQDLVTIMSASSSYCTDYYIKDFYVNLPSLWGMYNARVATFNFGNREGNDNFERYGYNRSSKKNIIDNITIILGEGPEIDEISSANLSRINTWTGTNSWAGNVALYIEGHCTWESEGYFRYANQANIATNISSYHPWGKALKAYSIYVEANTIRGCVVAGECTYIKIKNMSIKKARGNSIRIGDTCSGYIEIDNLLIEDTSLTNYVSFNTRINGSVVVNKTNYPVSMTSSVISSDSSYYNESLIVQKDIGDSHGFILKSLNRFVESCDIKHNSNNTLKMFGLYNHDRPLKFIETGDSGLSSIDVLPGKYKARINMGFYGNELYENTVTTPSSDTKNVLDYRNLSIGLKTKYGELSVPDIISLDVSNSNSIWSSDMVTPFYQEYYVDIYEPQKIFTTIERFKVYSSEMNLSNPTAAIFLDPKIELIKIGDIDYSNSNSYSNSGE